jgi:hypothetical protein
MQRGAKCVNVEFWACPMAGCDYVRAHKHQAKKRIPRAKRTGYNKKVISKPADERQASFSF